MSTLSDRFKEIRELYGLNQKEFSAQLGISNNHISSIENGKESPSPMLIKLICLRYNIDEMWLTDGIGSIIPQFDTLTDNGLLSKYNDARMILERQLKSRTGDELRDSVIAFSCFTDILIAYNLNDKNRIDYLEAIANCMDALDTLISKSYKLKTNKSKKPDYKLLLNYRMEVETSINFITKIIQEMCASYLKEYNLGADD
jgi:Predicted transcriptional regulator